MLRYLVSSGSHQPEDSGRMGQDDASPGPVNQGEDVSLPLGLLFNLMDVAEDGGQALLETGKSHTLFHAFVNTLL